MGTDFNDGEGLCVRDWAHRENIARILLGEFVEVARISQPI